MPPSLSFDAIIIGGSYAGLSAAMSLGRSLRRVLVIDSGLPCNRFTPHSQNFITHDGEAPASIAGSAKAQVLQYETVTFHEGLAVNGRKMGDRFEIETQGGETFAGKKLIFATGLKDLLPGIPGFAECWGKTAVHCPYCHGYELRGVKTGILANGDGAFHYAQLISNWTDELLLFTNGPSNLSGEQRRSIDRNGIQVIETEIDRIDHADGQVKAMVGKDSAVEAVSAIYCSPPFEQHCPIPETLGCGFTEQGLLEVDSAQQTTVEGVYAIGDCANIRAISIAVGSGTLAGAAVNHQLAEEEFG
jgi:thioredoxin reductase